jgi:hypothetical protein
MGIDLLFRPLSTLFDAKRREGLFYPIVVADGTGDDAGRFLLLEGSAILEPALEFVTV